MGFEAINCAGPKFERSRIVCFRSTTSCRLGECEQYWSVVFLRMKLWGQGVFGVMGTEKRRRGAAFIKGIVSYVFEEGFHFGSNRMDEGLVRAEVGPEADSDKAPSANIPTSREDPSANIQSRGRGYHSRHLSISSIPRELLRESTAGKPVSTVHEDQERINPDLSGCETSMRLFDGGCSRSSGESGLAAEVSPAKRNRRM